MIRSRLPQDSDESALDLDLVVIVKSSSSAIAFVEAVLRRKTTLSAIRSSLAGTLESGLSSFVLYDLCRLGK